MLQAESSCAREWNTYSLPQKESISSRTVPGTDLRTTPKTVYKVNNKRKLYIKCASLVFGYAFLLVFLCVKSATLGYQIENLQSDIQNIQTANQRLDYQIAAQSSLANVEQVATAQLGMYKPGSGSSLAMAVKAEPVTVAAASVDSTAPKSVSQKMLDMMYSSWSRLAQRDH